MADPFATSSDPDIPTPSRNDLLPLVHGSVRDQLAAGALDARHAENEWSGARRQWDEGHKRAAGRRRAEEEATKRQAENLPLSLEDNTITPPRIDLSLADGLDPMREAAAPPPKPPTAEPEPPRSELPQAATKGRKLRKRKLRRRRESERTQVELESFGRSMGFTPIGETGSSQSASIKPKQPIRSFLRHFAGLGFFVGSLAMIGIDEYALAGILLLLCGVAFFVQISEWPLFTHRKRTAQFTKGFLCLSVVVAFIFFAVVFWNRKGEKPWTNAWVSNQTTYCVFIADPTGIHTEYPLSVFVYGKEPMLNVTATIQPVKPDSTPNDIRQLPLGDGTLLGGVHPVAFSVPPGKYIITIWSRTGLITQELELRSESGRIVQTANVWGEGKRLFDLYADGTITKIN